MSQIPISCTGDTYLNNLSAPFFDNARRSPSKMAVVYEGQQLSNADLVSHVDIVIDILLEKNKYVIDKINKNFDLSPRGIREMLELNKPIYEKTAAYGHFGRAPDKDGAFSWEKTDKMSVFFK